MQISSMCLYASINPEKSATAGQPAARLCQYLFLLGISCLKSRYPMCWLNAHGSMTMIILSEQNPKKNCVCCCVIIVQLGDVGQYPSKSCILKNYGQYLSNFYNIIVVSTYPSNFYGCVLPGFMLSVAVAECLPTSYVCGCVPDSILILPFLWWVNTYNVRCIWCLVFNARAHDDSRGVQTEKEQRLRKLTMDAEKKLYSTCS